MGCLCWSSELQRAVDLWVDTHVSNASKFTALRTRIPISTYSPPRESQMPLWLIDHTLHYDIDFNLGSD